VPSEIGNKFKRLLLNEREFDATNWNREDVVESIENVSNDSEETSFNFYFFFSW
jgi:hypothetical protein